MEKGSKRELDRLRQQARRQGVTIRTQKGSSPEAPSVYSLVDRETGAVLHSDIGDLSGIQALLSGVAAAAPTDAAGDVSVDASDDVPATTPHDAPADAPGEAPVVWRAPDEICPSCGTPRVGHFRWCRSCGLDYEAYKESEPGIAPTAAQDERLPAPPELNVEPPELIGGPPELVSRQPDLIDVPFKLVAAPPEPDEPDPSEDVPLPPPPQPRPVVQRPSSARLAMAGLTDAVREWYPIAHWRQVLLAGILALSAGALVALMSGGIH